MRGERKQREKINEWDLLQQEGKNVGRTFLGNVYNKKKIAELVYTQVVVVERERESTHAILGGKEPAKR